MKTLLFVPGPGFGAHEETRLLGPRLTALGWEATFWNDPTRTPGGRTTGVSFDDYLDSLELEVRRLSGADLEIACHSAAIHPILLVLKRVSLEVGRIVLIAPAFDLTDAFSRVLGLAASDFEASQPDTSRHVRQLIKNTGHFADASMREGLELAANDPLLFTHYWQDGAALKAFNEAAQFPEGQFRPDVFFAVVDGLGGYDTEHAGGMGIPALAVFTTADPVINAEVSLRAAQKIFCRLDIQTFADVGHWLHLERPDAFCAMLTRD